MAEPAAPDGEPEEGDGPVHGDPLRAELESILLVADEPVGVDVLAEAVQCGPDTVEAALVALAEEYVHHGHGLLLRHVGGGWRLATHPGSASAVERYLRGGRSARLSQAALETLAIVAYEQPVTRSRISEIRGVDADGALRTLVGRGLVAEVGRADTLGQPLLYGTTVDLLERLGLDSIEQLPPLAALDPPAPAPAEPPMGGYVQARRQLDGDAEAIDRGPAVRSGSQDPQNPGPLDDEVWG